MSGHSKWSKIKRKKGANDAKRSKVWARITRDIMIAARDGGGNPDMNAKLALAVEKAKSENMPKENIDRAIKRGTGEIEGAEYVEVTYEGYGPHGVAFFVEVLTDNTNRSVADIRHLFSKTGGNLGTSGSVAFLFERKGVIEIPAGSLSETALFDIVADAGAEDLELDDDVFSITTSVEAFGPVTFALAEAGVEPESAGLIRIPTTTTTLSSDEAGKVLRLLEGLEDHQDVQAVFTTLELDDAVVAAMSD
ncbi:MAG TPA: YebC/PmpR family DNA-binding transcriptional regulator [Rhodothermales bacterium]|nr:YebC/PmpR family DNA-binding transcriptional regulator [Rhodothermales bacterium]